MRSSRMVRCGRSSRVRRRSASPASRSWSVQGTERVRRPRGATRSAPRQTTGRGKRTRKGGRTRREAASDMAMTLGSGDDRRVTPQMNVTPLVDVVLVLLIIFMVITPLLTKNFWVHTPKQEKEEVERQQLEQDPTPPLVLRVGTDRAVNVNGADVPFAELADRLRRMF